MPKKFFLFVLWKMSKREGLSDLFFCQPFLEMKVYLSFVQCDTLPGRVVVR